MDANGKDFYRCIYGCKNKTSIFNPSCWAEHIIVDCAKCPIVFKDKLEAFYRAKPTQPKFLAKLDKKRQLQRERETAQDSSAPSNPSAPPAWARASSNANKRFSRGFWRMTKMTMMVTAVVAKKKK
mmetsp:Transcript_88225/g.254602  ORF Transcript_88225/g.254602 Transcript_88225/m.254602 type:complete len:126 (-) Transcript_88225:70-447(-)